MFGRWSAPSRAKVVVERSENQRVEPSVGKRFDMPNDEGSRCPEAEPGKKQGWQSAPFADARGEKIGEEATDVEGHEQQPKTYPKGGRQKEVRRFLFNAGSFFFEARLNEVCALRPDE